MALNTGCAVVIATRNRPESLEKVLLALQDQTLKPQIVVIADSSAPELKMEVRSLCKSQSSDSMAVIFLDADFNSLTRQKNFAIKWLLDQWQGEFLQILDDDTIPPPNFLLELSTHLALNPNFIGASGVTHHLDTPRQGNVWKFRIAQCLGLESVQSGIVTKGGIGTFTLPEHDDKTTVEWLHGCSMWRLRLFNQIQYLERLEGSALCEDLEFSIRARRFGDLAVLNGSVLGHSLSEIGRPDDFIHSYRFARNRAFVFQALRGTERLPLFYFLANFGMMLSATFSIVKPTQRKSGLNQLRGLAKGTLAALKDGRVL